jgi:hypothetical protein
MPIFDWRRLCQEDAKTQRINWVTPRRRGAKISSGGLAAWRLGGREKLCAFVPWWPKSPKSKIKNRKSKIVCGVDRPRLALRRVKKNHDNDDVFEMQSAE